jgi:predicted HNH restriction endonuclease
VSRIRIKIPPLRLDPEQYDLLRSQVLRRDGWRCQSCGAMSNLEVHHKDFRSHSGDDSEENLITLCNPCHARVHRSSGSCLHPRRGSKQFSLIAKRIFK